MTKKFTSTEDAFICKLYDVADEIEANALDSLLEKVGYIWVCVECDARHSDAFDACESCGHARQEDSAQC